MLANHVIKILINLILIRDKIYLPGLLFMNSVANFTITVPVNIDQVRKAYDMEEDDETGRENFRIKATFLIHMSLCLCYDSKDRHDHYALIQL